MAAGGKGGGRKNMSRIMNVNMVVHFVPLVPFFFFFLFKCAVCLSLSKSKILESTRYSNNPWPRYHRSARVQIPRRPATVLFTTAVFTSAHIQTADLRKLKKRMDKSCTLKYAAQYLHHKSLIIHPVIDSHPNT